jgi:hypothetical protein
VDFEGKTNPDVYVEAHCAANELVRRYEQLLELRPGQPDELAATVEIRKSVLIAERAFREIYERLRNIREIFDDAEENAAAIERSKRPEPE